MTRRLPSLNQLRAFEAAARHESVKRGAEELCVTPTAVGHQIRALEQVLAVPLFHRQVRKVTLTKAGRRLAEGIGAALDLMEQAVAGLGPVAPLRITVAPFFGNRWLLPRLSSFHGAHPEIRVEPVLSFDYIDLARSEFDAAVRYGAGDWDGLEAALVYNDLIHPVCAPQLVEGRQLPLSADEILALPCAAAQDWRADWTAWAAAAGASRDGAERVTDHPSRAFMFDAALSGQAVILADLRMTAADEAAGRLVALSPVTARRPQGIHVVRAGRATDDARLSRFIDWLRAEAAAAVAEI